MGAHAAGAHRPGNCLVSSLPPLSDFRSFATAGRRQVSSALSARSELRLSGSGPLFDESGLHEVLAIVMGYKTTQFFAERFDHLAIGSS